MLNQPPKRDHFVYVLELDPAAGTTKAARKANPARHPEMPCVYLGQTSLKIEERIQRHLGGGRLSSRVVRDHYLHALPAFHEHLNPLTELESLRRERTLGRELRGFGYTVFGAK